MILVGRFMSPYVRRVAVAMTMLELPFERVVVNAITEPDKVREYNPIGRVPVLILDDGERLIESAAILDSVQEIAAAASGSRRILAPSGPERRQALQLAGIMTNTLEKAIYAFYETSKRPEGLVHPPVLEGLRAQARAGLAMLERRAGDGFLVGDGCTLADVTVGVGWRFLSLFAPILADAAAYPRLAAHSGRCEGMAGFAACQPETTSTGAAMPIIEVTLLSGRSAETKLRLIRALTDATIDAVGAPPENVRVMIREIAPENFAVGGVVKSPPRDVAPVRIAAASGGDD